MPGSLIVPVLDVVALYLGIERRGIKAEEAGGAGLVAAGLVEGAAYKVDLEAFYFVVKIDAAGEVDVA